MNGKTEHQSRVGVLLCAILALAAACDSTPPGEADVADGGAADIGDETGSEVGSDTEPDDSGSDGGLNDDGLFLKSTFELNLVDPSGLPAADVPVTIAETTKRTDAAGQVSFELELPGPNEIDFDPAGPAAIPLIGGEESVETTVRTRPGVAKETTRNKTIVRRRGAVDIQGQRPNVLRSPNVRVAIPPGAVDAPEGAEVRGRLTPITTAENRSLAAAPRPLRLAADEDNGSANSSSPTWLKLAGVAEIVLHEKGDTSQHFSLADGRSATLEFKLPEKLADNYGAGDQLDAFWFDFEAGGWKRGSTGKIVERMWNGERSLVWRGQVSHFSIWAFGQAGARTSCVHVEATNAVSGEPMAGLEVGFRTADETLMESTFSITTNADGEVCLPVPRRTPIVVSVDPPAGYRLVGETVENSHDTTAACSEDPSACDQLTLEIEPPTCVSGRAVDDQGTPLEGARVTATADYPFGPRSRTETTGDDGTFCVPAPRETEVELRATATVGGERMQSAVQSLETGTDRRACGDGQCVEASDLAVEYGRCEHKPQEGVRRSDGCPCNYDDNSNGVCGDAEWDAARAECGRPLAYQPNEETLCDGFDNDCDGEVDSRDNGACCANNRKDVGEDTADCGGGCGSCSAPDSCSNGTKDGSETDVDCGGDCPVACTAGEQCGGDSDCASMHCEGGVCQYPSCSDGIQNGHQTDVDCGGPICGPCQTGQMCRVSNDCQNGPCGVGMCGGPNCTPTTEVCDGTDNDCDGQTDEGFPPCGAKWTKFVGGAETDSVEDIAVVEGGLVAIGGQKQRPNNAFNGYFQEVDPTSGSTTDSKTFSASGSDSVAVKGIDASQTTRVVGGTATGGGLLSIRAQTLAGWKDITSNPGDLGGIRGLAMRPNPAGAPSDLYVVGTTRDDLNGRPNSGSSDAFVIRYDNTLSIAWTRMIGGPDGDYGRDVAVDDSGAVYVVGQADGSFGQQAPGHDNAFVAKYDRSGQRKWLDVLGSSNQDWASGVATDGSGNVYVVGKAGGDFEGESFHGPRPQGTDGFLVKYDRRGNRKWVELIGSSGFERAMGVETDGSGRVYVVGNTGGTFGSQSAAGRTDAFVALYDGSGNRKGIHLFGSSDSDNATDVDVDASGNLYVIGETYGSFGGETNSGSKDGFVVKF